MAGPEIIGYETDPNATDEQLNEAQEWKISGSGVGMWAQLISWPYSMVEINDDNRTEFFRSIGFRPIYRERDFKATLYNDLEGCSMRCRKCGYRWSTRRLPHDSAGRHRKVCYAD